LCVSVPEHVFENHFAVSALHTTVNKFHSSDFGVKGSDFGVQGSDFCPKSKVKVRFGITDRGQMADRSGCQRAVLRIKISEFESQVYLPPFIRKSRIY
jgi:hypothetical protein